MQNTQSQKVMFLGEGEGGLGVGVTALRRNMLCIRATELDRLFEISELPAERYENLDATFEFRTLLRGSG